MMYKDILIPFKHRMLSRHYPCAVLKNEVCTAPRVLMVRDGGCVELGVVGLLGFIGVYC